MFNERAGSRTCTRSNHGHAAAAVDRLRTGALAAAWPLAWRERAPGRHQGVHDELRVLSVRLDDARRAATADAATGLAFGGANRGGGNGAPAQGSARWGVARPRDARRPR